MVGPLLCHNRCPCSDLLPGYSSWQGLAASHYYTALELVVHNNGQLASGATTNTTNLLSNKAVTQPSGVMSYCPPGILSLLKWSCRRQG